MSTYSDDMFTAKINAGLENDRTNPAVRADAEFRPEVWTEADEVAYQAKHYGSDADRLQKLVDQENARRRRTL